MALGDMLSVGLWGFWLTANDTTTPDPPTPVTRNTKTYVLNVDTGAWGRYDYSDGVVCPSCYSDTSDIGPVRDSNGCVTLYVGDDRGYVYQTNGATGADGVTGGTKTGTVTAGTTTTTTCSAATFRTTGDGLSGLGLTIVRAADGSTETVLISSNTATIITHAAWSGASAVAGDTVYVGAIRGTLAFGRLDLGTHLLKAWRRIGVVFQKQSHAIPLKVGYSLDNDTAPTASTDYAMNNGFYGRLHIHRNAYRMGPYLRILGVSHATEIFGIEIDVEVLPGEEPTR